MTLTGLPMRHLFTVGKILISATLITLIIAKIDFSVFSFHWHKLSLSVVGTCLIVLALQTTLLSGLRLKLVLGCLKTQRSLANTTQVAVCGFFFEQIAFGFVGGDGMRLWLLHRIKVVVRTALEALLIDRCIGLLALLSIVLAGFPSLMHLLTNFPRQKVILMSCVAVAATAAIILLMLRVLPEKLLRRPLPTEIRTLASMLFRDVATRWRFLIVFSLALTAHLMNVMLFYLIGQELGISVSLSQWFIFVPAALLFSMIPVSVGGWGLREGILVFALQGIGVSANEAVVPSIAFGLGVLLVSLPGGIVWLIKLRREPATRAQSADTSALPPQV